MYSNSPMGHSIQHKRRKRKKVRAYAKKRQNTTTNTQTGQQTNKYHAMLNGPRVQRDIERERESECVRERAPQIDRRKDAFTVFPRGEEGARVDERKS